MEPADEEKDKDREKKWLILIALLGVATLSLVFFLLPGSKSKKPQLGMPFASKPKSAEPKTGPRLGVAELQSEGVAYSGAAGAPGAPAGEAGAEGDLSAADILGLLAVDAQVSTATAKQFEQELKADPEIHRALSRFKASGGSDVAGLLATLGSMPQFQGLMKKFKLDKKFGHGLGSDFDALGRGGRGAQTNAGAAALAEALKRYKGAGKGIGPGVYSDGGLAAGPRRKRTRNTKQGRSGGDPHYVEGALNASQWQARLAAAGTQESQAYDFGFSLDAWAALQFANREVLKTIETEGHNQPGPPQPSVATCSGTWCRLVSCGKGCVKCQPKYPFGNNNAPGGGCGGANWDYNQNHDEVKAVCKYFGFEDDCKQACINHPPCDMWSFTDKPVVQGDNSAPTPGDDDPGGVVEEEYGGEDGGPGGGTTGGPGGCVVPCDYVGDPPPGCRKDPTCPE
ncbi:MAG: hypothetical protein HY553_22900 [Elusimicrobia bacterium]|nr:hypothetical protein [Elusimicrobiota bacterium]